MLVKMFTREEVDILAKLPFSWQNHNLHSIAEYILFAKDRGSITVGKNRVSDETFKVLKDKGFIINEKEKEYTVMW